MCIILLIDKRSRIYSGSVLDNCGVYVLIAMQIRGNGRRRVRCAPRVITYHQRKCQELFSYTTLVSNPTNTAWQATPLAWSAEGNNTTNIFIYVYIYALYICVCVRYGTWKRRQLNVHVSLAVSFHPPYPLYQGKSDVFYLSLRFGDSQ